MLFSSYLFLLLFLPIALLGYALAVRYRAGRVATAWLVCCSFVFYAWKTPEYLALLVGSIGVNFAVGRGLVRGGPEHRRRLLLAAGITFNLSLIGFFKYGALVASTAESVGGRDLAWSIVLPIGISFYTFQQIAYLVDIYRQRQSDYRLTDYAFFVSFFPQLIAGPIVHHRQIMPQLRRRSRWRVRSRDLSIGVTMLTFGLFKKIVLADQFAVYATPIFAAGDAHQEIGFAQAWLGALAFTLQLYFDFSGYSDMAIGIARLFGIRLPVNFHSPYRAENIIDFWRRWHLTLSRFLRDYLYIPLGGNRRGRHRRYVNLLITMLLGGLWHGAAWTFVVWGGWHGLLLCLNHAWRWTLGRFGLSSLARRPGYRLAAASMTFLAVVVGWVLFRSETFSGAGHMLKTMAGLNGFGLDVPGVDRRFAVFMVALGLGIVWCLPNTQTIMRRFRPVLEMPGPDDRTGCRSAWERRLVWRPSWIWALWVALLAAMSVVLLDRPSEFIYYQF